MERYDLKEVLKKLKIEKTTFYKYINTNENLKNNRIKYKNQFFYNENFVREFEKVLMGEEIEDIKKDNFLEMDINEQKRTEVEQKKTVDELKKTEDEQKRTDCELKKTDHNIFLEEIKKQFIEQIDELKKDKEYLQIQLKNDKEILQRQLDNQMEINLKNTEKIESLLLNLIKITNKKDLEYKEEINEIEPENIIKEVQKTVEEKNELENQTVYYKNQLEQANKQAEEYKRFKNEKENLIEKLKEEYQKAKFFEVLKKARIKKELEKVYLKGFDFVQYV